MKKHIFVFILVFLTACSTPLKLSDKNSGTHQTVCAGQKVIISLDENPTTGYSWQFFITPAKQNTITDTAETYIAPDTSLIGAGGIKEYSFFFRISPSICFFTHFAAHFPISRARKLTAVRDG